MARVFSIRLWAAVGILILSAGLPYCAAALGWAATQDDHYIYVREDVAMGIFVGWIGWTILAAVVVIWFVRTLAGRRVGA